MVQPSGMGNYFWRGRQRIELEKEEEFFTVIAKSEEQLEKVRQIPGVQDVKPVENRVFKVQVSPGLRDQAMDTSRSKEVGIIAHHAYRPHQGEGTRYYLTDQISVKFKPETSVQRIEVTLQQYGLRLIKEYPGSPNTYLLQVTDDAKENPIKVANKLAELAEVEYAEPNLINRFQPFYVPADPLFPRQWHLKSSPGPELAADAHVSATDAWDITRGNRSVVVALLDDGFDLSHPDFTGVDKVKHAKDYVDGDSNPFPTTSEGDYHGTPCAGVAIAEENNQGVVGVAPGCSFMPVRFPLSADDDLLWEIFDYVGRHADVISCSWGPPPVNAPLGQLVYDKFHELATTGGPRRKGCVMVFAAGNYNAPLNDPGNAEFIWRHPDYGLVRTTGPILNGNATHPDVIAVAASISLNNKAYYSNWGDEISVCAPSNNFDPLNPNTNVPGRGIWTTDNEQFGQGFTGGSRFTGRFGGTSSATPLVAGVAALALSVNPHLTAGEVKQILQDTADKISFPDPGTVNGLNNGSYTNGCSRWFGYGKVNAAGAVRRARDLLPAGERVDSLQLASTATGTLAGTGETLYFKVTVSPRLTLMLDGPTGQDFDLYVKRNAVPTTQSYDAVGYSPQADEKVTVDAAGPGDYYIMVYSYRGAGNFSVQVKLE